MESLSVSLDRVHRFVLGTRNWASDQVPRQIQHGIFEKPRKNIRILTFLEACFELWKIRFYHWIKLVEFYLEQRFKLWKKFLGKSRRVILESRPNFTYPGESFQQSDLIGFLSDPSDFIEFSIIPTKSYGNPGCGRTSRSLVLDTIGSYYRNPIVTDRTTMTGLQYRVKMLISNQLRK